MDKTCGTCEYYYACDEGSWDKDNHALDENAPGCENWEQPAVIAPVFLDGTNAGEGGR